MSLTSAEKAAIDGKLIILVKDDEDNATRRTEIRDRALASVHCWLVIFKKEEWCVVAHLHMSSASVRQRDDVQKIRNEATTKMQHSTTAHQLRDWANYWLFTNTEECITMTVYKELYNHFKIVLENAGNDVEWAEL